MVLDNLVLVDLVILVALVIFLILSLVVLGVVNVRENVVEMILNSPKILPLKMRHSVQIFQANLIVVNFANNAQEKKWNLALIFLHVDHVVVLDKLNVANPAFLVNLCK